MFNPSLVEVPEHGIHHVVKSAIEECPEELQAELYAHVALGGGNTCFPGFGERLEKELSQLTTNKVKVYAGPKRAISASIGGSIISSLSTFQAMWIPKEEYDELGPAVVRRRCIY